MTGIPEDAIEIHDGEKMVKESKLINILIKKIITEVKRKDDGISRDKLRKNITKLVDRTINDISNRHFELFLGKACPRIVYCVEDKVYKDYKNFRQQNGSSAIENEFDSVIARCIECESSNEEWQDLETALKSSLQRIMLEYATYFNLQLVTISEEGKLEKLPLEKKENAPYKAQEVSEIELDTEPEKSKAFELGLLQYLQHEKEIKEEEQKLEQIRRTLTQDYLKEKQPKKEQLKKQSEILEQLLKQIEDEETRLEKAQKLQKLREQSRKEFEEWLTEQEKAVETEVTKAEKEETYKRRIRRAQQERQEWLREQEEAARVEKERKIQQSKEKAQAEREQYLKEQKDQHEREQAQADQQKSLKEHQKRIDRKHRLELSALILSLLIFVLFTYIVYPMIKLKWNL